MPFFTPFYSSCLVSADTSIQSNVPTRTKSILIPSVLYRRFFKRRLRAEQPLQQKSSGRKRSAVVRKVPTTKETRQTSNNNYDMTILHEEELKTVHLPSHRRRVKKIPSWANQDQLELAMINQIYFQPMKPEEIFGAISIDSAREMINEMMFDRD